MEPTTTLPDIDVTTKLGISTVSVRRRRLRMWLIGIGAVLVAVAITVSVSRTRSQAPTAQYRAEEVRRGNLTVSVEATGELEPLTQVNVGTEISGIIETVAVNYNDRVRAGQALAKVNTDKLTAQAQQARASLDAARAKVQETEATVEEARRSLVRARQLFEDQLVSASDRDTAETTFKRAEATHATSRAQVSQSEATLNAIETDLQKATIRSPIDGVVLDRQIDPGQTVAASFQTPVLFTLAGDLSRMKLSVDVDEADVGSVRVGQEATFTVDAYANRVFTSRVVEVRNTPRTVNGVVTYETFLSVDNSDLLLRPGMTATAEITVTRLNDALLVPNAALRFTPAEETEQPASGGGGGLIGALLPRPPRPVSPRRPDSTVATGRQRVWILRGNEPVPIDVIVGATDGNMTEIVSSDLSPGSPVLVDVITEGG